LGNYSKPIVEDKKGKTVADTLLQGFGRLEISDRTLLLLRAEREIGCELELNSEVWKKASTCETGTRRNKERKYQTVHRLGDRRHDLKGKDWLSGCD
jgi:hypothetical protein